MNELVLDIDFGAAGNSHNYALEGFGSPEGAHTWSVGQQCKLRLDVCDPGGLYTLTLWCAPWLHPPFVMRQLIMLSLNDRLFATVALTDDCALAFDLPPLPKLQTDGHVLAISHLDSPRSVTFDAYRDGRAMALMMRSVRLFRRGTPLAHQPDVMLPILGRRSDSSLTDKIEKSTGLSMAQVMNCFESLGQWCRFAEMQQELGADRVCLLRFAGIHQAELVEGLTRAFVGIGDPEKMEVYCPPELPEQLDVHDHTYRIWWHTCRTIHETNAASVLRVESVRMPYLQRKFLNSLKLAHRVFVHTVPASEPEILAIFTALNRWADNTLLYVTQSDERPPGSVERVRPRLFRGYINKTEIAGRGSEVIWLSVLANAAMMSTRSSTR